MRELYIEGVAIHGGPELCVGVREDVGEALAGVRAGRAIEPRNDSKVRGADALVEVEGNIVGGASREPLVDPARSENLGTYGIFMLENREIPWSPVPVMVGAGREGKAEAVIP